jgi:GNAT superfamily N-acetyltransferase
MPQHLPAVTLKSGETLEILRIPAPCGEWGARLVDFMYIRHLEYANCSWHHNCVQVVAGYCADASNDVFFAGLLDGEIVGTCWYAAPRDTMDLATFGRVVTAVPHRRKGISTALCAATVDDFGALGGKAMHLGTGRTNPARYLYEALGFRHNNFIDAGGTVMRLVLQGEYDNFESEYFEPGQPVKVRPLNWGDLARAELLCNLPHWFVKDYTYGVYANTPYEGQFFGLMNGVDRGETGVALHTNENRLVGLAYTAPTNAQAGAMDHVRVLEFLAHPAYAENAAQLVAAAATDCPVEKLLAYSSALDVSRCEALEEAGFTQEATLENCLQDAESVFDLYVYSLSR